MTDIAALYQSDLPNLRLLGRGKVRDMYEVDEKHLLIVTTDRMSAFDVVLPNPIPGKGLVLTRLANFWFDKTKHIIANHIADDLSLEQAVSDPELRRQIEGRAIVVKRLKPLPVEAIVRGYLIGSGWKDYLANGKVCGIVLPNGLKQAQQLPEPIFTPSSKAEVGVHDENISFSQMVGMLGETLAEQVRNVSLQIYGYAAEFARQRGIIIADTKFEFGLDDNGVLHLIDEVLTPDSSRFWPADQYRVGISPPSFDKQYLRDYLETLDWDKTPPGPRLPEQVAAQCSDKYREAAAILIGD
ncbi:MULTISPECIES: phosphoribosylaminoimidazolesuccinocarboxamide synthase [Methylomonas]|uniref:phosphoribosylaminoimidazolesuccinocarboxamide synthase n=1 Tax=Methylomonas TaxID=416 RepID=UPI001232157A|nr:phosphoribosylaminoimidazolesuccinocarboxamide synthase [Methylomonas rhizoryzae]